MGDLRRRYDGVEAALGDVAVATEITGTLHRPAGEGEPWCGSTAPEAVDYVETEVALEYGADLCQNCYRAALAHLARMSSSPVSDRRGRHDAPPAVSTDASHLAGPEPPQLDALTAAVLVTTNGANTYHAPGASGEPLCGESIDTTRRRVDQTPPTARPCQRCFTAKVVAEYDGRDSEEGEVVEAIADGGR